jgi:hypothetical protein
MFEQQEGLDGRRGEVVLNEIVGQNTCRYESDNDQ